MYRHKTSHYEILSNKEITKEIIKKCSKAYNKNRSFFGKDCKFFKIRIANTEDEFKKLIGKVYKKWFKGFSKRGRLIIIISPKLFYESYKKFGGTPKFEMLLAHEINHIYAGQLNLYKGPYWFTEGLAMYVAGQIPGKTFDEKIRLSKELIRCLMFYKLIMKKLGRDMYISHYYGVKFLLDNFGKQKLLKLINSHNKNMKKSQYEKSFKRIFRVSYKEFLREFTVKFGSGSRT